MRIALAQLNYHIGNFEYNTKKIINAINDAKAQKVDLIVFGELSVCGYPPLDFLEFDDFIYKCLKAIDEIALACKGIAAIVGSPTINPVMDGKNLYNSAYFLEDGKIKSVTHKALLPTYDVFDEYRYFEPAKSFECITCAGKKIALTICEDLWNLEDDPLYTYCPMDDLVNEHPDFIVNIAASPFSYVHAEIRKDTLKKNALKYHLPIFYIHQVGAQTDIIFDGGSMVLDKDGSIVEELNYFEEEVRVVDFEVGNSKFEIRNLGHTVPIAIGRSRSAQTTKPERIHSALLLGIKDFFTKMNFKTAALGMSGGIDSAVVYALTVEALRKENVFPVMMPSQFSSEHSVMDSERMITNLGTTFYKIPVADIFQSFENELNPLFKGLPFNVAEENLQARIRGSLLMTLANKFGHILLNTSNKSELAVGYGTLYGDMCGGLSVIGDLYKTDVYELAHYINRNKEIIPANIITKAPSAELRPGQKDSDSLPAYEVLDNILFQYIENRKSINDIISLGIDEALVKRVLRLVNNNEFKRYQFAPILRVSPHAFGLGRRMPIVAKYLG
ncbi:MAG: NAD+ synthase [Bacteroidia bacterium]